MIACIPELLPILLNWPCKKDCCFMPLFYWIKRSNQQPAKLSKSAMQIGCPGFSNQVVLETLQTEHQWAWWLLKHPHTFLRHHEEHCQNCPADGRWPSLVTQWGLDGRLHEGFFPVKFEIYILHIRPSSSALAFGDFAFSKAVPYMLLVAATNTTIYINVPCIHYIMLRIVKVYVRGEWVFLMQVCGIATIYIQILQWKKHITKRPHPHPAQSSPPKCLRHSHSWQIDPPLEGNMIDMLILLKLI